MEKRAAMFRKKKRRTRGRSRSAAVKEAQARAKKQAQARAKEAEAKAKAEAEAEKTKAVKEAEAEAGRIEIQAKAEAEAKFLAGQGISRQRKAIMEGLRESVTAFKTEVSTIDAKTVMDLMIVTQYFDMMKDVGAQGKTAAVFMNASEGGDLSSAVSKGFMSGLPAAPGFAQPMGR